MKDDPNPRETPERPLDLDPERAKRVDRPPYAIVDIGSNSVRLVVYDQLGRAPLPRFNEKSLCRLGEGLAETGLIAEDHFRRAVAATRRFRAIADAMGVGRIDVTATEAMRRAANGPDLALAIEAASGLKVRILSGAEEARYSTLGVISGFFRPVGAVGDMGGGSLEVSEALDDRIGPTWVSLPLGALPVESMLADGLASAKERIDAMLRDEPQGIPAERVLSRRRRLAVVRQRAYGGGRSAGPGRPRLCDRRESGARLRQMARAFAAGETCDVCRASRSDAREPSPPRRSCSTGS